MVSCSQDDALQDTVNNNNGSVPVTLSATIEHGVQTRATSETDDKVDRCLLQIIESDGTNTPNKHDVQTMDLGADGSYTATAMLNPNNTYTFLFWADDGSYTATDLEVVTIAGEDGAGIAWYGSASWSSSESTEIKATLTHAVTKVTLQSTTAVPTTTTATISGITEYSQFDVLAGSVTGDPTTTYTHSGNGKGEDGDVFSFYALVSDETQNLTLQTGDQPEVPIPNVPLAQNKHVILKGDVANAGLTEYTFTATIDTDWASTETLIEGLEIDENGTYIVATAEGLLAWASYVREGNWSTNCTLAADINMSEKEWVQIGSGISYDNIQHYRGTFDGAGHTISNLTGGYALIHSGSGCTIKNVVLDKPAITNTGSYAAGIIGYMGGSNASITNCHVIGGTISCNASLAAYAGGICSIANNAIISACSSTATVSATTNGNNAVCAGGLVGALDEGTLTASYYAGQGITVSGGLVRYAGGVAGVIYGTATACYWSCDEVTRGVGYGSGNTTKVDNDEVTWADAAAAMNEYLTDYRWEVNEGDDKDDVPLVLVSK